MNKLGVMVCDVMSDELPSYGKQNKKWSQLGFVIASVREKKICAGKEREREKDKWRESSEWERITYPKFLVLTPSLSPY